MDFRPRKKILFAPYRYEQRLHLGILKYAQEHDWDVLCTQWSGPHEDIIPDVDGQIVGVAPGGGNLADMLRTFRRPVVTVDAAEESLNIPRVGPDYYACGRMAAQYLVQLGFKRFATIRRADGPASSESVRGFHSATNEEPGTSCLDLNALCAAGDLSSARWNDDQTWLEQLLAMNRPLGVFCAEDADSAMLARELDQRGISVPEEIAIVGINNDPTICPFAVTPLSSVDPDFEQIGYRAAECLDGLMQSQPPAETVQLIHPSGIISRRSSRIRAVDDIHVAKALRYIWDHASERLAVSEIAGHAGIPLRTLQHRFKKRMGYSLQDEVTKTRVAMIRDLLENTNRSVNDIAQDLHFSSVQYLTRIFSRVTGDSPLRYRRRHAQTLKDGTSE